MIEIINETMFHLYNEKISYVMTVLPNQQLGHVYFGPSLGKIEAFDQTYLDQKMNKSAGTVKFFEENNSFTLADRYQELPTYGTSDFREGALTIFEEETPLYTDFQFNHFRTYWGKERDICKPASFAATHESQSIEFELIDTERELRIELTYTIFQHLGTIARKQKVSNMGSEARRIERFMSGVLELKNRDFDWLHLSGAWLKERHIKTTPITQGTMRVGSLKGASGHQHNPFVALKEKNTTNDQGFVYGANLIYSGNFLAQVEMDEWNNLRLMLGIHPEHFSWKLEPGASFETPECIFTFSDLGMNGLSQESARFVEKHIIPPYWQEAKRPIVFNNWEATYFDFDEEKLLALAKESRSLGMECFVLDDGWFGKRNNDRSSLGDWVADPDKFPNGISHFAQKIHSLDLKLGVWFEPEMVSPDSMLYQEHPEWVVKHPYDRVSIGRGQYVLDFANPAVVEAIFQAMEKVIIETKLDYIKWDMNRNITEAYSAYLAENGIAQTEFYHRYMLGVYDLYQKILSAFPTILIEGCAGGGGRYDLGILFYSPQIWPSDDSDAVERLTIQTGTLLGYPMSSFSNHVSASPNHQVGRMTSLMFRQHTAMFGPLGYELDLFSLSRQEKQQIKEHIAFYKQHRRLLTFGTFYQLETSGKQNEVAWAVYDSNQEEALIGVYRVLATANPASEDFLQIPFLDADRVYQVNETPVSGRILKNFGLRKPYQFNAVNHETAQIKGDFQSFVYHIQIAENKE
ncbi:alpha-galactosidase [Enterococcus sp. DIV0876]|uniref:alpha-galactosidase n=1 Tax=Enterococcus sp. DIV0876 TaxID=2774633 RepID=UPI003D2FEE58